MFSSKVEPSCFLKYYAKIRYKIAHYFFLPESSVEGSLRFCLDYCIRNRIYKFFFNLASKSLFLKSCRLLLYYFLERIWLQLYETKSTTNNFSLYNLALQCFHCSVFNMTSFLPTTAFCISKCSSSSSSSNSERVSAAPREVPVSTYRDPAGCLLSTAPPSTKLSHLFTWRTFRYHK